MSLILKSLSKKFDGKIIFDGFSYEFKERGIYALVGESGSGKTTLIRMIAGLDTDFGGEIAGGGIKNVSLSFQEHRLFPGLSAIENALVALQKPNDETKENQARELLRHLGFSEGDMSLLPSELSGGMKQRVSIVRAILKPSPILLLDEPTKELDRELAQKVNGLILEEAKKRLVVISTHNEKDIEYLGAEIIEIKSN